MTAFTKDLIEEFYHRASGSREQVSESLESMNSALASAHRSGEIDTDKDIDYEMLFEAWAGEGDLVEGRRRLSSFTTRNVEVQEHALDVMASSQFAALVNTTIQQGTLDFLSQAPFVLLNNVDRNISLDQNTNKLFGTHDLGDIVQPADELEETPLYGIQGRTVTVPKAQKEKFALGLTRELLALDTNSLIRTRMRQGAQAMGLHAEKLLADMIFECYDTAANPWPYTEDDTEYRTYYTLGDAGPWENKLTGNGPDASYAPIQAINDMMESWSDDYTGEPVIMDRHDFIMCSDSAQRLIAESLGPLGYTRHVGTDQTAAWTDTATATQRSADGRFNNLGMSHYARRRLTDYYQTTAGGSLSAANALIAAQNTWVMGDLQRAFGWGTEWALETVERSSPDSWEYFNQEIALLIKYLWKVTPVVKNPRVAVLNRP